MGSRTQGATLDSSTFIKTHKFLRIHKHRHKHRGRNSLTLMRSVTKKTCTENQSWTGWRKSRRIAHFAIGIQLDFVMRANVMRDRYIFFFHMTPSSLMRVVYFMVVCSKFTRVEFYYVWFAIRSLGFLNETSDGRQRKHWLWGSGDAYDTDDDDRNCKRMIDAFTSQ